jgi:hypothetical protein
MDELQIYGKNGLFHNILKASAIMRGRYAVLPNGGVDLNANNILSGLDKPDEKYPMGACLAPSSYIETTLRKNGMEYFNFTLFFLCRSKSTGDNQIKFPDPNTKTSLHSTPEDWSDMKTVALSFMSALETVSLKLLPAFRLGSKQNWRIQRLSEMQNDNLSGVMVNFEACLAYPCEFTDIDPNNVDTDFPTHEQHLH